jgi:prevent-host-death family protein
MTSSGYHVVMKQSGVRQVRIAELKARLSEYLRAVRRGETVAVLDRETPIARIVPIEQPIRERVALRVRKPTPGTSPLNRVPVPKPGRKQPTRKQRPKSRFNPRKASVDVVHLLLEERQGNR